MKSASVGQKTKVNKTPSDACMKNLSQWNRGRDKTKQKTFRKPQKHHSSSQCAKKTHEPSAPLSSEHRDTAENVLESPQAQNNHSNSSNQQRTGSRALVEPKNRLRGKRRENQWNHRWQLRFRHLDREPLFLGCCLKTKKLEHWVRRFSRNKAFWALATFSTHSLSGGSERRKFEWETSFGITELYRNAAKKGPLKLLRS